MGVERTDLILSEAESPMASGVIATAAFSRNMLSLIGDGSARVFGCNLPAFLKPDVDDDSLWFEITDDDNLLTQNTPVVVEAPVAWMFVDLTTISDDSVSVVHAGGS